MAVVVVAFPPSRRTSALVGVGQPVPGRQGLVDLLPAEVLMVRVDQARLRGRLRPWPMNAVTYTESTAASLKNIATRGLPESSRLKTIAFARLS